ncbi:hypothetical protein NESM_000217800 [Novymonas esmeraldas]|uniref:Uncharacterized protein n=1 Tax=Novymonas esmeraldas TaxID=1808958 RepID=A0AAW0F5K9_9TRYP
MLVFWNNGFLRPLILLGVWLFGNTENEILTLDNAGERHIDLYGSDGSPFARLAPDLRGDGTASVTTNAARETTAMDDGGGRDGKQDSTATLGSTAGVCDCRGAAARTAAATSPRAHHLPTHVLQEVLAYRQEGPPLPLAVAAAGPQLRLVGERVGVFLFPGAATSLRGGARPAASGGSFGGAAALQRYTAPSIQHGSQTLAYRARSLAGCGAALADETEPSHCRVVRGPSLEGVTAAMCSSAWWYGRPAARSASLRAAGVERSLIAGHDECAVDSTDGGGRASTCVCIPLCVEVVSPRVLPRCAATTDGGGGGGGGLTRRVWRAAREAVACVVGRVPFRSRSVPREAPPLDPADERLQRTAAQFVALVNRLWRLHRCALVELVVERYPVGLTEWLLTPEQRVHARVGAGGRVAAGGGDWCAASSLDAEVARGRRAFQHLRVLRCRGRVSQSALVTVGAAAPTVVSRSELSSGAVSASSPIAGRQLHPATLLSASACLVSSLSLTAVRPHLRLIDLSNTTTLTSLDGLEAFVSLEKIVLTRCARLRSLSPLGAAPSLRDVVASQSGIVELTGLARSRTIVSLSLYGCLRLTDVSACGAIATLHDVFVSESTVTVLDGLRESRSLARLGMRYCDVPLLTALSPVSSLTVLHASGSMLTSVVALQHCASLEVVEVSACAQLFDLGPLGLAPNLRELDATGSGVRQVTGLERSCSLERLSLAQCVHLDDVGPLGLCASLRDLQLSGVPVRQLDGLASAPSLRYLDISFCRQLASFSVLPSLRKLRRVSMGGCTMAQRRGDEAAAVVASLTSRLDAVTAVLT